VIGRTTIRFEHELLAGVELPCFEAAGRHDGPHVSLIGGIHGGEYSSIAAVIRVMRTLDASELRGRITAVPVVSMPSFRARSAFVVPVDSKNLNRCFPGSFEGTFSDVLARAVFDRLIAPADALLDLHGGDMVEALEPFTLYDESPVEARARELAVAFGLRYVVRNPAAAAPIGGMTSTAAARAGVPAVIAEAGGCGLLDEEAVRLLADGVGDVLRRLELLPGEPRPPRPDLLAVGRFVWLRSTAEGWWEPKVRAGEEVEESALLGTVKNLYGDVVEEIRAPEDGVPLFITSSPAVEADGLLLGLGADLAPIPA
jgi:predicted deacylase